MFNLKIIDEIMLNSRISIHSSNPE
jgi:hypothetical protein